MFLIHPITQRRECAATPVFMRCCACHVAEYLYVCSVAFSRAYKLSRRILSSLYGAYLFPFNPSGEFGRRENRDRGTPRILFVNSHWRLTIMSASRPNHARSNPGQPTLRLIGSRTIDLSTMTEAEKWRVYEVEKEKIIMDPEVRTTDEYERRIRALVRNLGI